MAHDEHVFTLCNQVFQRAGNDAAFHLRALFHAARDAAVKSKAVFGFDGSLVAAAAQSHIQRLRGHIHALAQRFAAAAHTDGKRHRALLFPNGAHRIQNGKARGNHLAEVALFHHGHIA